jgi:D-aspartate ligase
MFEEPEVVEAQVPAVVLSLYYSGLALVRSLARRDIQVFAMSHSNTDVGLYSKYAQRYICPDPKIWPDRLLKYLRNLGQHASVHASKPVLFPTGDEYVLFVSRNRGELEKRFEIVMADRQVQESLVSKSGLHEIAIRAGIPDPQTYIIESSSELPYVSEEITYPCVIKPAYSKSWHKPEIRAFIGRKKVIKADTPEMLIYWYHKIAPVESRMIVQEVIPGGDDHLYYVPSYLDRNSRVLGAFVGRKVRVTPIHFGSASFVETIYNPKLLELNRKLLHSVKYRGLVGVEYKFDPRDGKYKLIEVNARWGLWDGLGAYCGVDLAHIAYLDAIGQEVEPVSTYQAGKKWFSLDRDLSAFLQYRKEGSLDFKNWLNTLGFGMMHACFAMEDLGPSVKLVKDNFNKLLHFGIRSYL